MPMDSAKRQKVSKEKLVIYLLLTLIVLTGLGGLYLYDSYMQLQEKYTVAQETLNAASNEQIGKTAEEIAALTEKIKQHMLLPDEEPVVATIDNADALKEDNEFYANTQNDDVVFIYQKALKALIYRESEDILINVGPVYVDPQATQQTAEETIAITVEVLNASSESGRASDVANQLSSINERIQISTTGNAKNDSYEKTQLVNLTDGTKDDLIKAITDSLGDV